MIASERSEPNFSYLALETCDSSQCFVGKYFCRYNKSSCWFKYDGLINDDLYRQVGNWKKYIYIFILFKIINFVRTFIRYTSINYGYVINVFLRKLR